MSVHLTVTASTMSTRFCWGHKVRCPNEGVEKLTRNLRSGTELCASGQTSARSAGILSPLRPASEGRTFYRASGGGLWLPVQNSSARTPKTPASKM
jgi:hypothetical protein